MVNKKANIFVCRDQYCLYAIASRYKNAWIKVMLDFSFILIL